MQRFVGFTDDVVDQTRALYEAAGSRERDWVGAITQQATGRLPDLGGGSTRRYNVLEVRSYYPGEPRRSGERFWRLMYDGLNMKLWYWARYRLEHSNGAMKLDRLLRPLDPEGNLITVPHNDAGEPLYPPVFGDSPVPLVSMEELRLVAA